MMATDIPCDGVPIEATELKEGVVYHIKPNQDTEPFQGRYAGPHAALPGRLAFVHHPSGVKVSASTDAAFYRPSTPIDGHFGGLYYFNRAVTETEEDFEASRHG